MPFLDRAIPEAVARQAAFPKMPSPTPGSRALPWSGSSRPWDDLDLQQGHRGSAEQLDLLERRLRAYIEEFLARMSVSGAWRSGGGGMVVLRDVPGRCTSGA